jgi:hypothetical protein
MLNGQGGSATQAVLGSWQVVAVPIGEPQIAYYEEATSPSKRSAPQSQYRDQILNSSRSPRSRRRRPRRVR